MKPFHVQVGDQVYLQEGGEEIGAVREVARDHLVIYVEGAGDFVIEGPEVVSSHHGKLILDPTRLPAQMRSATERAHELEAD